ncbi:hypothetical protein RD792_006745 [Penstemon davidsonii]|uniref:Potassium transporter n=1 Tax=Penstemon davidsonii TaxID=160366 RepID=A0ABR0DCJ8_9LAMI|nr:hypothetical protein RD792_006745 [Penstemon davidsonii]
MFVVSTLAAVVSSQSMISATFSIVKQSQTLGCFPRVNIIHTSSTHEGQVYSPEINYILMILTVGLVIGFKGGVELANAYDLVYGIPPIIRHYIQHMNSVREILVIVTIRTLPIKTVLLEERFNVGKLGHEGVYWCLVQFGYKDSQDMKGDDYVVSVVNHLLEIPGNGNEKRRIQSAAQREIVFVTGRTVLKANRDNGILARFTIDHLYRFLQKNSRAAVSTIEIPPERTLQVGMLYEI